MVARKEVDVAVIGAGTAGLAARRAAAEAGARTVLIEAGPWGTTCVRAGCMPSKLLLIAARAAHAVRHAPEFGIKARLDAVDGQAAMARMHALRDRFLRSIAETVDAIPEAEKFIAPAVLQVAGWGELKARAVVIATGAVSIVPDFLEPVRAHVLTSETVFDLTDLPQSLAVIGAGPLGIELGAAFTRLGVRTAIFDQGDTLGGLHDRVVAAEARRLLGEELDLHLGVELQAVPTEKGVQLRWCGKSGSGEAGFDRVLAAVGRTPNLRGLGLEESGLALDKHGTPVFDRSTMQCGDAPAFIAGDADHDRPVLHGANEEGTIAGSNAARWPDVMQHGRTTPLSIVFTDPDIATVGAPLSAIDDAIIGHCDFEAGRALIEGRPGGVMRVYAQPNGVIAGAEMIGPAVEYLIHLVAGWVQAGMTAAEALRLPFYHPTYAEDLKDCLRDLRRGLSAGARN